MIAITRKVTFFGQAMVVQHCGAAKVLISALVLAYVMFVKTERQNERKNIWNVKARKDERKEERKWDVHGGLYSGPMFF